MWSSTIDSPFTCKTKTFFARVKSPSEIVSGFSTASTGLAPRGRPRLPPHRLAHRPRQGDDFHRAALVVAPADEPLALERLQVLVHGGERSELQARGDFFERGRVAVPVDEADQEIQHLLLPPRQ